jgi:hypothetical protein
MKKYTINLDKERELRYDLNAMCAYESLTGKSAFAVGDSDAGIKATDIRALLWSCLLHGDPTLSAEEVGKFITVKNLGDISTVLTKVIGDSVDVPESQNEVNTKN